MKLSIQGLIALVSHEGIVLTRYKDSVGVWTIGVGHTAAAGGLNPATFTGTLTIEQATDLLRTDIARYEADVIKAVKVPLKQHEFDALVSFHYNTGAIARADLTKSLNLGNRPRAGREFLNYLKPKEIAKRRRAESRLFLKGEYPPPVAVLYSANAKGAVLWRQGKEVNVRALLERPAHNNRPDTPPHRQPQTPVASPPPAPVPEPAPEPFTPVAPAPLDPPPIRAAPSKNAGWFTAAISLALMILKGSKP